MMTMTNMILGKTLLPEESTKMTMFPCKICNSKPKIRVYNKNIINAQFLVLCRNENCYGQGLKKSNVYSAIANWNMRMKSH